MEKVTLKDLYRQKENYADKDICIEGWVRTIRDSKTFGFIAVSYTHLNGDLEDVYMNIFENKEENSFEKNN